MVQWTISVPHACKWCSRKFLLRNHLILHMQTHHADQTATSGKMMTPPLPLPANGAKKTTNSRKYHLKPPQHLIFNTPTDQEPIGQDGDPEGDQAGEEVPEEGSGVVKYEPEEEQPMEEDGWQMR